MEFRTKVPLEPGKFQIDHEGQILLLGSCFAENIGEKFKYYKFRQLLNPTGILFHPAAIHNFVRRVKEKKFFTEEDIFFHQGAWHSYEVHSSLSSGDKNDFLSRLNNAVSSTHDFLEAATHVVLTMGTAWGYRLKENGQLVANCHKMPQENFRKELVEVQDYLSRTIRFLEEINPRLQVILTISPVRHLRDGFVENQRSKAYLVTAIHELISTRTRVHYFPAYEILLDELRDYRFYGEDMIHPSPMAINYIWERFSEEWFSEKTAHIMKRVEQVQKGLSHRPFQKKSQAYQDFQGALHKKKEALKKEFPHIRFNE